MNKNLIMVLIAILVIGGGAYFIMNRNSASNSEALMEDSQDEATAKQEEAAMRAEDESATDQEASIVEEGTVKEFSVIAKPFLFNQKELRVKKGDTVRITLDNQEGTHDWVVDEFNARTKVINAAETDTVEFVADKTGTFEFYCSVGNHRAMGMVGNLIVE